MIFAFTLKNEAGETKDWHIDLKESGKVGKGIAPEGKKAGGKSCPKLGSRDGVARYLVAQKLRHTALHCTGTTPSATRE